MNWFFCHVLCKFLFIWLCQVLVAAFRISAVSWGSFVAARRLLSSYDAWAWLLRRTRDLISPTVIEPVFPALEGGFLTTGSPGKSLAISLKLEIYIYIWLSFDKIRVPNRLYSHHQESFESHCYELVVSSSERLNGQDHLSTSVLPIPILEFYVCVLSKHFTFIPCH